MGWWGTELCRATVKPKVERKSSSLDGFNSQSRDCLALVAGPNFVGLLVPLSKEKMKYFSNIFWFLF